MTGRSHIRLAYKVLAELGGTFGLVFLGCGAPLLWGANPILSAADFGLAIALMIALTAPVSGGHLNPAVSLGLFAARGMSGARALAYAAAQCLGAYLAALVLNLLAGSPAGLTTTQAPLAAALGTEIALSLLLVFVIFRLVRNSAAARLQMALLVGLLVAFESIIGAPISGASMNPARSLGPALAAGVIDHQWIYLAGPLLGGTLGALLGRAPSTKSTFGLRTR